MSKVRRVSGDDVATGDTPAYWDHQWEGVDIHARVARAETRPSDMERLLVETIVEGPVLEAGCGSGWVLEWERRRGHLVVGLDFAERTLRQVRRDIPDALLVVGNLERMPFRDGVFRAVISLGALEHIEHGPAQAIAEHERVLRRGGVLFATLPRVSWVKAMNDGWALRIRRAGRYRSPRGRWVSLRPDFGGDDRATSFIQYELPTSRWVALLRAGGLVVERRREIFVGAGLGEVALVRRRRGGAPAAHEHDHDHGDDAPVPTSTPRARLPRRFWDAGVRQTPTTVPERAVAWLMRRAIGHMALLVARKPS